MDCEKIKSDFKKRYESDCERIYFMGKPLTFFKGNGSILGCSVSAGCYFAMEKRDDDRLMVQFSHADKFITVNSAELEKSNDDEIFQILLKLKKIGVKVGGVRMFFYRNSRLETPDMELLLSAAESFCENVPPKTEPFRHFEDFETGILASMGKANYLSFSSSGKNIYFPFRKDNFKIVLCHIQDKGVKNFYIEDSKIDTAAEELKNGNYKEFGRLLNMETEKVIKKNGLKITKKLFDTAVGQKESLGNGVLVEGGIFSLVENKYVDFFIRNVSAEYRRYYGAAPDFYVTDTEECGWIK